MSFSFAWEVSLMEWLQGALGSLAKPIGSFFTMFGEEMILVAILGFLYWCYNKELAKQIGMMMVVGLVFNPMLKNVVMRRRPYFDHEGIKCLKPVERGADIYDVSDQGYSFPSAHSMNSGIMYWGLASRIKNKVLRTVLIILPFAVGISRCILGVHYPTDVLCGWIAGALIMAVLTAVLKRLRRTWKMYLIFF